jgi:serine O-acetyltransferase
MTEAFPAIPSEPPRHLTEVAEYLRADAARYADRGGWAKNPGFWIGATHRLSEWARLESRPLRRYAMLLPLVGLTKLWRASTGVSILEGAAFGPGLCIPRPRSVMIGRVRTGRNVLVSDHVTIGTNANSTEFAVMGSDIEIGAGARILGPVRIGDGARVGPNAVVARSVPPGAKFVTAPPGQASGHHDGSRERSASDGTETSAGQRNGSSRSDRVNPCAPVGTHQP